MNQWSEGAVIAAKAAVGSAVAVPVAEYVVPMWGTTPASFVLAAIGAVMSYAWDKREDTGFGLVFKTMSVTLFSVACVVVLPDLGGWDLMEKSEPPLAFILALFGRHIIPALRKAVPTIARGIAGMFGGRNNSGGDYGGNYQDFPTDPGPPRHRERDVPRDPPTDQGGY